MQVVQISVLEISNSERDLEVITGNCLNMSSQHKAVSRSSCTFEKKNNFKGMTETWGFFIFLHSTGHEFPAMTSGHTSPNEFPAIAEASGSYLGLSCLSASGVHTHPDWIYYYLDQLESSFGVSTEVPRWKCSEIVVWKRGIKLHQLKPTLQPSQEEW